MVYFTIQQLLIVTWIGIFVYSGVVNAQTIKRVTASKDLFKSFSVTAQKEYFSKNIPLDYESLFSKLSASFPEKPKFRYSEAEKKILINTILGIFRYPDNPSRGLQEYLKTKIKLTQITGDDVRKIDTLGIVKNIAKNREENKWSAFLNILYISTGAIPSSRLSAKYGVKGDTEQGSRFTSSFENSIRARVFINDRGYRMANKKEFPLEGTMDSEVVAYMIREFVKLSSVKKSEIKIAQRKKIRSSGPLFSVPDATQAPPLIIPHTCIKSLGYKPNRPDIFRQVKEILVPKTKGLVRKMHTATSDFLTCISQSYQESMDLLSEYIAAVEKGEKVASLEQQIQLANEQLSEKEKVQKLKIHEISLKFAKGNEKKKLRKKIAALKREIGTLELVETSTIEKLETQIEELQDQLKLLKKDFVDAKATMKNLKSVTESLNRKQRIKKEEIALILYALRQSLAPLFTITITPNEKNSLTKINDRLISTRDILIEYRDNIVFVGTKSVEEKTIVFRKQIEKDTGVLLGIIGFMQFFIEKITLQKMESGLEDEEEEALEEPSPKKKGKKKKTTKSRKKRSRNGGRKKNTYFFLGEIEIGTDSNADFQKELENRGIGSTIATVDLGVGGGYSLSRYSQIESLLIIEYKLGASTKMLGAEVGWFSKLPKKLSFGKKIFYNPYLRYTKGKATKEGASVTLNDESQMVNTSLSLTQLSMGGRLHWKFWKKVFIQLAVHYKKSTFEGDMITLTPVQTIELKGNSALYGADIALEWKF